jgi:lactate dehydrogenase-like 2-hydroxyacid dehydrogenase/phosphoserine aminotransferase
MKGETMNREELLAERNKALAATQSGPPARSSNPFFGVGPITDAMPDEVEARKSRFEFEHWLEQNYRKRDDKGRDLGPFTTAEISRSMHRGYPADKFIHDMMREIHSYFGFPKSNRMAVGLGGGHSGFTVAALHLISAGDLGQNIFIDTPRPESDAAKAGGFFRQSWGAQLVELMRLSKYGDENRLHFSNDEGHIPAAGDLQSWGVKLMFGVGHETTGATNYSEADVRNLLTWLDADPDNHHAMLDATSLLGAMPWDADTIQQIMTKCCFFMPFQKAIGGICGYFVISFTPQALALVEKNQRQPGFAIPRQLKLAAPVDAKKPLTGERSINIGPFYDPATDKMLGGVINTFSTLAFAETTFALQRMAKRVGPVANLNTRSVANRDLVSAWISQNSLLEFGVTDASRRGAAVTLFKVNDPGIRDAELHGRIIARSKQLLAYDGVTHPDGTHETGLDVARYLNAFPGTPGDYRAWIGGIRDGADVVALLENVTYAYARGKIVVLEEELSKLGHSFQIAAPSSSVNTPTFPVKILVCDHVGLRFNAKGKPDHAEVKAHIEAKGGVFFDRTWKPSDKLISGKLHFFYQPDLSTEAEILLLTNDSQYDAVIAAATFLPKDSKFPHGGVRIGTGTGNMVSASWGGGNGVGGTAPLMNTPSFNSRATAQMAMKALLKVMPNLDVDELHKRTISGRFDTGKNLKDFPTEKLEGKTIAIIGYGNIGREVAKLAAAFGMKVKIHARPRHKIWIESEGFIFCATEEDAAAGADVLSVHTGLGPYDAKAKRFANEGEVSAQVFAKLNTGAVLLNYDRGECVDVKALDKAMKQGIIRYAAIDADVFKGKAGKLAGPMAPYIPLAKKYKGRLELLPHAAADTEHVSRVEGAKQAVNQIFECVLNKCIINGKGDVPAGYVAAGAATVPGVGRVTLAEVTKVANSPDAAELRKLCEAMTAIWGSLETSSPEARHLQTARHGQELLLSFNRYCSLMRKLGLEGPLEG